MGNKHRVRGPLRSLSNPAARAAPFSQTDKSIYQYYTGGAQYFRCPTVCLHWRHLACIGASPIREYIPLTVRAAGRSDTAIHAFSFLSDVLGATPHGPTNLSRVFR